MARPRTPTALKVIKGNPGKRDLPTDEPKPKAAPKMTAPAGMSKNAKKHWVKSRTMLDDMGVLTSVDKGALMILCEAMGDYFQAIADVEENGIYYTTENQHGSIMHRRHPCQSSKNESEARLLKLFIEFGMTPASRSRVKADPKKQVDPKERHFGKKRA